MKVKELMKMLEKFNPECRVLLDNHGRDSLEKADEIIWAFEDQIYDGKTDEPVEDVVVLKDY